MPWPLHLHCTYPEPEQSMGHLPPLQLGKINLFPLYSGCEFPLPPGTFIKQKQTKNQPKQTPTEQFKEKGFFTVTKKILKYF